MLRMSVSVAAVERKRGPVWYARYRLPGSNIRSCSARPGPAAVGTERLLHKRLAEDWLRDFLYESQPRRGLVRSEETGCGKRSSEHCQRSLRC